MHDTAFAHLVRTLADCRAGALPASALAQAWRGETALLAALPPRYGQVLEDILVRLESAGLFSEESCSFSQRDLLDGLIDWLEKAQRAGAPAKTE